MVNSKNHLRVKKVTKSFFLIAAGLCLIAGVQTTAPADDNHQIVPPPQYQPENRGFWNDVQAAMKDKNYEKVLRLSRDQIAEVKKDSLENAEAQLATAMSLKAIGFTFGATTLLGDILKTKIGTEVAKQALVELDDIARNYPVDEDYLFGEILNDLEFDSIYPTTQDFVSFHQGMFNLLKGFPKWADQDFKKINPDSFWDFKLKYLTALGEVARDRLDSAVERFSAIANNQLAPPHIRSDATHQFARLLFEKGDYTRAYKSFRQVELNPREKGLILLERAWAKYYEKDYSKALGLLAAMEAPIFDTARSPEPYVLRMLMYKELCYYNAAFDVLREFKDRFGAALAKIKGRKDLKKDQTIVNLAVLDRRLQKWVDFLNQIKDEKAMMADFDWDKYWFSDQLKKRYEGKISEVNQRLDWMLASKTREVANDLLDWQEQLTFLEYQTRLDSLRVIKASNENDYKPEEIPHLTFDKIYWISHGEFWLDELEDLKVFVESRCTTDGSSK